MFANATPNPFPAAQGFTITCGGGRAPYDAVALSSPPNPRGVQVSAGPPPFNVTVSPAPSPGTVVYVDVSDSSTPPQIVHLAVPAA